MWRTRALPPQILYCLLSIKVSPVLHTQFFVISPRATSLFDCFSFGRAFKWHSNISTSFSNSFCTDKCSYCPLACIPLMGLTLSTIFLHNVIV